VILEIADQRVFTPEDFRSVVEQLPADKSYPVKLIRDTETISVAITPEISE
jgi:S1-C subfamily serine protease